MLAKKVIQNYVSDCNLCSYDEFKESKTYHFVKK